MGFAVYGQLNPDLTQHLPDNSAITITMTSKVVFISKVILASLLGSLAIKYIAPEIPIPVNGLSALTIIFTPVIVMIGVFILRGRRSPQNTP